jgi:hypothetical protein
MRSVWWDGCDGDGRNSVVQCNWRRPWNEDGNSAAVEAVDLRPSSIDRWGWLPYLVADSRMRRLDERKSEMNVLPRLVSSYPV